MEATLDTLSLGSKELAFANKTLVMGILNVTPDSFSDGGRFDSVERAQRHALKMLADGADIIDIGGESTRPGSDAISADEEMTRVIPVIERIRLKSDVPISIDTSKAVVARAALEAGADIINDISGLTFDAAMPPLAAETGVPVVVMHTFSNPKVMQKTYRYDDVVEDIFHFFKERLEALTQSGIQGDRIILDPGIGFGKSIQHNCRLIRECRRFGELGCPILIGASRKSFIGAILDADVNDRLEGSLAAAVAAAWAGANIIRAHDVKETVRALQLSDAISGRTSLTDLA